MNQHTSAVLADIKQARGEPCRDSIMRPPGILNSEKVTERLQIELKKHDLPPESLYAIADAVVIDILRYYNITFSYNLLHEVASIIQKIVYPGSDPMQKENIDAVLCVFENSIVHR